MYQFAYEDIQTDSIADARDRERQLLGRCVELLVEARDAGAGSRQSVEAVHFLNRVWASLIDDLGNAENALPKDLRANLISVGLWLMREAEEIRQGRSQNFDDMIEITQIIRDGIQ